MRTGFQLSNLAQSGVLWLNGDASYSNNSLLLTNDQALQRSSSYYAATVQIDSSVSFNTKFQFRLGGAVGANSTDGFTFVLQNDIKGAQSLGVFGGNVGYGGIDRSVAIKFDTFKNATDINDNSISLVQNGQVLTTNATVTAPFDLDGGQILTAWVDYNGLTDELTVYLADNDTKPGTAVLTTTIDIASILGNQAYVGFTAGSGDFGAKQEILSWDFLSGSVRASAAPPASALADINLASLSTDLLSLNGATTRFGSSLQLTPDAILQRGSSFYATPFQVRDSTSFQSQFQFRLDGQVGTNGSDGFAFVLQNSSTGTNALGDVGSGTGLWGIDRSLGIRFDSFQNEGDLGPNTISVVQNGNIYNPVAVQVTPFDLNNGATYTAWVEYDGLTNQLQVFLAADGTKPATAVLTQTLDLATLLGNQAYAGFTASTGAFANRQSIDSWQFRTSVPIGNGDGLRAEYFDNADFTNLQLVRVDNQVNFNWGAGSPDANIQADSFAVRWFGQVQPLYTETYTFHTNADDNVQLVVNGQVLVNGQTGEGFGTIALVAGQRYDIELRYVEGIGAASMQLGWSSASQLRELIPQSQLFTAAYNPGTILMGSEAFSVRENAGTVTVQFDRVGGSDGYATVNYNTASGTATAGNDFVGVVNNVTFLPGETTKTVTVNLINDEEIEANEQFGVALGQTAGAGLGTRRTVGITVLDDDGGVSIFNLSRNNYSVAENGQTAVITVQRSGDTTIAASVGYTVTAGTATAGTDFVAATGTVEFAAGELTKTFAVAINDDQAGEVDETINVALNTPTNGRLGAVNTGVLTIQDNDSNTLVREDFLTNLVEPTAFEFAPGGELMFVAEKRGVVKVARNGVFADTFIDISDEVNGVRDRGLIGIAVHPQFFNGNPYIYLSYTYDPPEAANGTGNAGRDGTGNRPSRVLRVTADAAAGYTKAVAGSGVVILGKNSTWQNTSRPDLNSTGNFNVAPSGRNPNGTWIQDYLATDSESHSIGDLAFGADGALYVTNGDGTSYSDVDPRTLRVLDLDNLSGKMLRIDPITGAGLADNPFYNGDPNSNRSKVLNYGLRNPFRFTFDAQGTPVIGDVGWTRWEEINIGRGQNFGWPYFEGPGQTGGYNGLPQAQAFYNSGQQTTGPAYATEHNGPSAIVVGDFYRGAGALNGGLFVSDASQGTIDVVKFNANGTTETTNFARNIFGVVQILRGPDGSMYFANLPAGKIERWRPA
jgi:glucose/arabinose dehydrogenase